MGDRPDEREGAKLEREMRVRHVTFEQVINNRDRGNVRFEVLFSSCLLF